VTDQETQKAMMAWYYRKQEEQKVCCSLMTLVKPFFKSIYTSRWY